MTENELHKSFREFNSRYFGNALACELVVTDNWVDAAGHYYSDSAVILDDFFSGGVRGRKVQHAKATCTHAEKRIRIPRALAGAGKATKALLLHEMAHAAAREPDIDHGPEVAYRDESILKTTSSDQSGRWTPGRTEHKLVNEYGVGSEFWEKLKSLCP